MRFPTTLRVLTLSTALGLASACGSDSPLLEDCPAPTVPQNAVMVPLDLQTVAGNDAFALNKELTTASGIPYKVTKFRYYLSSPKLVDGAGKTVDAQLVTRDGRPVPYGVALVDATKPDSGELALMAAPGNYSAVQFMIGVPDSCSTGEQLNHGDASARLAPLDVDTDMYWSWNPGYIHLKVEGQAKVDGSWKSILFHVGEDKRREQVRVEMPLQIASGAHTHLPIAVDVTRLFVNDQGATVPDFNRDRVSHGGVPTDRMAENIARSGFFRPGTTPAH
jgi:hypothetical protein